MTDKKQILILGVGNTLLTDEGFGVHAVRYLESHYQWPENVRLLDGGTRGLLLMADIMDCDLLIILDILLGGQKPGTFYIIENNDLSGITAGHCSMHQPGIGDVLVSCELAGHKPEALVFGFEPFDFQSTGVQLSAEAEKLLPEYCDKLVKELHKRVII